MVIARYRFYLGEHNYAGAAHWLLRGLECEKMTFGNVGWNTLLASGTVGTLFEQLCVKTSQGMIEGLTDEHQTVDFARSCTVAKEIVESVTHDDAVELVNKVSSFQVLSHLLDMTRCIVDRKPDRDIATKIIACLEDKVLEDGGLLTVANPSLRWGLLRLANTILERDIRRFKDGPAANFEAAFSVGGMRVLNERFSQIVFGWEDDAKVDGDCIDFRPTQAMLDQLYPMRLALSEGLMCAMVTENAKRKKRFEAESKGKLVPLHTLDQHTLREQDQIVRDILDF